MLKLICMICILNFTTCIYLHFNAPNYLMVMKITFYRSKWFLWNVKLHFSAGNGDVSTHPLPKSSAAPACLVSPPLNPFYQCTTLLFKLSKKIEPVFQITSFCSFEYAAIDKLSNSQLNPTGGQVPLPKKHMPWILMSNRLSFSLFDEFE